VDEPGWHVRLLDRRRSDVNTWKEPRHLSERRQFGFRVWWGGAEISVGHYMRRWRFGR